MSVRLLFLVAALVVASIAAPAQAQRYAYIPNSGSSSVTVIDTQTNTVLPSTIAVGAQPWAVSAHPNGRRVYVANVGPDTVSVIDTTTQSVVATVAVGSNPYHLAVSPDGTEVWVPNYGSANLSIINTASNTVVATIGGLPSANAIAFHPDGSRAYVTDYNGSRLYVINTATRSVVATPTIGNNAEGIAVHPSGRFVYTTSQGNNASSVSILDTSTNTVTQSASIGQDTWGVAVHPNGRYYYVGRGTDRFDVMSVATNARILERDIGSSTRRPTGISITPHGNFAYVANRNVGSVAAINLTTNNVVTDITVGSTPYALGVAIQRPLFGHGGIALGQYHSCRIRSDQSADCWGRDDYGQATAPAGPFFQLVAGSAHTCGLRPDNTVVCWGNNSFGQTNVPAGSFVQLTSGARHVCAVRTDRSAVCWGQNDRGQASAPTGVFQGISAGSSHTCGLRTTGAIECWGNNDSGQATPVGGSYTEVIAGASYSCGLLQNGNVNCWGDGTGGRTTPPTGAFAHLVGDLTYSCGLRFNGNAECWGSSAEGANLAPGAAFGMLATGRNHACGLRALGVAECWGWNLYNQAPQFALNPLSVSDGTVGSVYPTTNITMEVANAGPRYPYAPRSPGYGLVAGSLPPGLALSAAGQLSGTPTTAGTYNFTVQGEDLNGFVAERAYAITIGSNDPTAPVVSANVTGLVGNNGWYRGDVTVSWTVTDPESAITSQVGCDPVVISTETAGTDVTCEASSAGGTTTETVTIKLDRTAPTVVPMVSNTRPVLNEVIALMAVTNDNLSGVASESCDATPTNVVSLSQVRVFCTATDEAGNSATKPAAYRVIYGFQGFTETVLNPGWWNGAPVGQAITFKFRVVDADGTPVTGLTSATFNQYTVACPAPNKIANTVPASADPVGLVHTGDGNYEFTWVGPASPVCQRLELQLGDGNHTNRALVWFQ